MVDRDLVGQAWSLEVRPNLLAGGAERGRQELARAVEGVEGPPAVEDANPKAAGQEGARSAAPIAMLWKRAAKPRHVVAAVVVENEEAASRSKQALGGSQLLLVDAAKRGPQADEDVQGSRRSAAPGRGVASEGEGSRAQCPDGVENRPAFGVDEPDVPPADRAKRLQRGRDLALHVQRTGELGGQVGRERDGQVGHGRGV